MIENSYKLHVEREGKKTFQTISYPSAPLVKRGSNSDYSVQVPASNLQKLA
jgi:hypothetical protein